MGVLDDLKKEADQVRQQNEAESRRQENLQQIYRNEICPALLKIHGYLLDLVAQLEVVSWKVEAPYEFPGIGLVKDLVQEDYRVYIDSTEQPTRVVLNMVCRLPKARHFIVKQSDANDLRDLLFAQEASYTTRPHSGSGGGQELAFESRLQVKASISFEADIPNADIDVLIVNFDQEPLVTLDLPSADVDDTWLDGLGNYVLRRIESVIKRRIMSEGEKAALRAHLKEAKKREKRGIPRPDRQTREQAAHGGLLSRLSGKLFGAD